MITPNNMEKFTNNDVVIMYQKLNERLSKTIISKLRQTGDISSFTRSQIRQLELQGGKEIFKKALEETAGLNKKRKQEIQDLFEEIGEQELKGYSEVYKEKGIDYELSKESKQLIKAVSRRTNGELKNLTKTIAYASQKTFVDAMDELYKDVASGSYAYDEAMKRTINELADKGVTLKTKDGRHEKLEVAVKRNMLTSIKQTANSIAKDVGDIIGANCVVIGHSTKCRPTHHPIDSVTMSIKEFKSKYEYLTEEPNCYHIVNYDWQPEFENADHKVIYDNEHQSYAQTVRNYNIQQKARYYERQVRDAKRNIVVGGNNKESRTKLRNAQAKIRAYDKQNNIERDYSREWTPYYNK